MAWWHYAAVGGAKFNALDNSRSPGTVVPTIMVQPYHDGTSATTVATCAHGTEGRTMPANSPIDLDHLHDLLSIEEGRHVAADGRPRTFAEQASQCLLISD
jgi:hypothetical protein